MFLYRGCLTLFVVFFFQAEDGIRDFCLSRGLGDVYKRQGHLSLPIVPNECQHNAHMFYIKVKDLEERTALISYLKARHIHTVFHYIPLHSSPAGKVLGRFHGEDRFTTKESERLLRLPMYYGLKDEDVDTVLNALRSFWLE